MARHFVLHVGDLRLQPGDGVLEATGLTSVAVLHVPHLPHQGLILDLSVGQMKLNSERTEWTLKLMRVCVTYGAFKRVDLTSVGLDLVSELHRLLSCLLQGLIVLTHCLVQVGHLVKGGLKLVHLKQHKKGKRLILSLVIDVSLPHLGLVPVLSLSDVLGGDAFVLGSDISQCRCQVRLGHVHLDLDLSLLHLGLQLTDLLQGGKREVRSDVAQELVYILRFIIEE